MSSIIDRETVILLISKNGVMSIESSMCLRGQRAWAPHVDRV
jgi:hypothetical protein